MNSWSVIRVGYDDIRANFDAVVQRRLYRLVKCANLAITSTGIGELDMLDLGQFLACRTEDGKVHPIQSRYGTQWQHS